MIDVDDPLIEAQPSTPLPATAPADIACVICTSGTTGTPKGVAVTHQNLTQLLTSLDASLPRRGVAAAVPLTGLRRLGVGDRARPAPGWPSGGGARISGRLSRGLPSIAGRRRGHRLHPDAVRSRDAVPEGLESAVLVVAGEACPTELVDRWAAAGRVMFDAYGPTETTICAAMSAPLQREPPGLSFPSVHPSPALLCSFWTPGCNRYRPAWWANCTWPETAWRAATSADRI